MHPTEEGREGRKELARKSLREWKDADVPMRPVQRFNIAKAHGLSDDDAREIVKEIFG